MDIATKVVSMHLYLDNVSGCLNVGSVTGATRAGHALEAATAIDEEDIRKSVLVEAKRRKVWGSKAVAKMEFFDIEHSTCYRVSRKIASGRYYKLFPVMTSASESV